MTELDFSQEGRDRKMHSRSYFTPSLEDEAIRLSLLPALHMLRPDQRAAFDEWVATEFGSELAGASHEVARHVLRNLDFFGLEQAITRAHELAID